MVSTHFLLGYVYANAFCHLLNKRILIDWLIGAYVGVPDRATDVVLATENNETPYNENVQDNTTYELHEFRVGEDNQTLIDDSNSDALRDDICRVR